MSVIRYALCPLVDSDCNSVVSIVDVQLVAGAWNRAVNDPCNRMHMDLNGKRLVDVAEIATVAERWSWADGSNCYGGTWRSHRGFVTPLQSPAGLRD